MSKAKKKYPRYLEGKLEVIYKKKVLRSKCILKELWDYQFLKSSLAVLLELDFSSIDKTIFLK